MVDTGERQVGNGRRAPKSPEAFRTISEVADDLDVPQHVLRFWESKFTQVRPLKRGGGRRYYRPEDVDLLRGIRHLLYVDGFTIKGVQKLLKENGAKSVVEAGRRLHDGDSAEPVAATVMAPAASGSGTGDTPRLSDQGRRRLNQVVDDLQRLRELLRRR
ncbi:MAG: MerR family transcriptional regulator [Alphaproteobacteria bacterium]